MNKNIKKVSQKKGLSPGTLIHIGPERTHKPKITVFAYHQESLEEFEVESIEQCFPVKEKPWVTWINIDGIHFPELIEKVGSFFNIHPLILEDILNANQRPKFEDNETYLFIVIKMFQYNEQSHLVETEQISLILGENFVISFQEKEGDVFEPIRARLRNAKGRIRQRGSDYLAYALIDAIVDNYFVILEKLGEKIDLLEAEIVGSPSSETLNTIYKLKRELILLRKSIYPVRELVSGLYRDDLPLIKENTRIFLRDVYDHSIQVIDTIETFRDMISGMLDTYLSSISNRMNEVMKVLTIIATIFIPLTFIAGVYGMNFEYMPELKWHWGYFFIWGVMVSLGVVMLWLFRKRKWL